MRWAFFLVVVSCSLVLGEVSFFEGEGDGFVMVGDTNFNDSSEYCGNAVCDEGEDCVSCMRDCGSCVDVKSGFVNFDEKVDNVSSSETVSDVDVILYGEDPQEEDYFVARVVFLVGIFAMILFWGFSK